TLKSWPRWQLDRWYRNISQRAQELSDIYRKMLDAGVSSGSACHEFWPYNFGEACSAYNGCQYLSLCQQQDPELWYDDFDIRVWDPLAKDPTHQETSSLSNLTGTATLDIKEFSK